MSEVIAFSRVKLPYGWLCNMSEHPVETCDGRRWRTTEHLFQALRFPTDREAQESIRLSPSPMAAKRAARALIDAGRATVEPRSMNDLENMERCSRLKITQHPDLRDALIRTGSARLVADVTLHRGVGSSFWGAARGSDGAWYGDNHLGRLWMRIREELT